MFESIKRAWFALPYRYKAAIVRFLRVAGAGAASGFLSVSATGLGPKAAVVVYGAAIITGIITGLDVYARQVHLERELIGLAFDGTGDPDATAE